MFVYFERNEGMPNYPNKLSSATCALKAIELEQNDERKKERKKETKERKPDLQTDKQVGR